jgi:hypothetical protein
MPRPRFQFSIRWMLVAIAFISVLGSHVFTSWKLKQSREEVGRMATELGRLTISNPDTLNVLELPTYEDMTWRWRVHVPSATKYRLLISTQEIPSTGVPSDHGSSELAPGEYIVTAAVRRDRLGRWRLTLVQQNGTIGMVIPEEHANWLTDGPGYSTERAGSGASVAATSDEPFVFLRLNCMQKTPGGGGVSAPPGARTEGIMIWVDEKPMGAPSVPAPVNGPTGESET